MNDHHTLVLSLLAGVALGISAVCYGSDFIGSPELSLDTTRTVTLACGLTVPALADSRGLPCGPVGLRRSHPAAEDLFDVYQMWRADQFVAAWHDPSSNVVTLLRMAYPFPPRYQSGQFLPADLYYRDVSALAAAGYPQFSLAQVQDWIRTYYRNWEGTTNATPLHPLPNAFQACYRFALREKVVTNKPAAGKRQCTFPKCNIDHEAPLPRPRLVHVFQLRSGGAAGREPAACYALEIKTERALGAEQESFARAFLNRLTFDAAAPGAARSLWSTMKSGSAPRAQAVRGILNTAEEWRAFHTDSFALISDNPAFFEAADAALGRLQQSYSLFPSVLPPFGPAGEGVVCPIRVYDTDWEFEGTVAPTRRWSGGYYSSGNGEVVVRHWGSDGVLAHECTHQYLHLVTGGRHASTWFNEGFASYFGGCRAVDGRLVAQPINSGHLLVSMMKNNDLKPVADIFTVEDFYEDKEMWHHPECPRAALRRAKNYTAAWGVIYFLREAPSFFPDAGYERIIPLYWETLQKTGDADKATKAAVKNISMPGFLADFQRFFLRFKDDYARRESRMHPADPRCECEYCDFLKRTQQEYPAELALADDAPAPATQEPAPSVAVPVARREVSSLPRATAPSRPEAAAASSGTPGGRDHRTAPVAVLVCVVLLGAGWWFIRGRKWLLLLALLSAGPVLGDVAATNGLTFVYRVTGIGVEIYNGGACAVIPKPKGELLIPARLGGRPVTAIGDRAFERCPQLESVRIPDSVNAIGPHAFLQCPALTSAAMPRAVATIGAGAFYGCGALKEVRIPELVNVIGDATFFQCGSLTNISMPAGVRSIGDWAFSRCYRLASVGIPNSVSRIGNLAFSGCSSLGGVTIPGAVVEIGSGAFKWCSALKMVRVPEAVTQLGSEAFAYCTGLAAVTLPDSITAIGNGVFKGCSALTTLRIPHSVTVLGDDAFYGCYGLRTMAIPGSVVAIGSRAFQGCHKLADVTMGASVATIGPYAFYGCHGLSSVTLPDSLTDLGSSAFSRCANLDFVSIPGGVDVIPEEAFSECTSLSAVTIAPDVRVIGSGAFVKCATLQAVALPDSVNIISDSAFGGCAALNQVRLGEAVSHIGPRAFADCSSLMEIGIPDSITTIGGGAFKGCGSLVAVEFAGRAPSSVGRSIFDATPENLTSYVPQDAAGWGRHVPGLWNERPIRHQRAP